MLYENNKIKQRDLKTLIRFQTANNSSNIMISFFNKGFRSYESFRAIILNYYPEIEDKRLWDFWHFRIIDNEICKKAIDVFNKLDSK
jgi:hypothetical protein